MSYTMYYVIPISSFSFYTSPICLILKIHRIFLTCLLSFLNTLSVFLHTLGVAMLSVLVDDAVWSMQVLKGEVVVIEKSAQGHFWS